MQIQSNSYFNHNINQNYHKLKENNSEKENPELKQDEQKDENKTSNSTEPKSKTGEELTTAEKMLISKLQARDLQVRAHEQAHMSAGAGLAGSARYTYQEGPDGKMYAIGGEVPISIPASKTPEEAIANARKVRAAALAPADPSPQDYKVAATATMMEMKAQMQLREQEAKKLEENNGEKSNSKANNYIEEPPIISENSFIA